jgi:hypothetical protein
MKKLNQRMGEYAIPALHSKARFDLLHRKPVTMHAAHSIVEALAAASTATTLL